jgi:hypothetical protein
MTKRRNLTDVDELASSFRKQAEALYRELDAASNEILSAAKEAAATRNVEWMKKSDDDFDDDDDFIDIVSKEPHRTDFARQSSSAPPLLALMPSPPHTACVVGHVLGRPHAGDGDILRTSKDEGADQNCRKYPAPPVLPSRDAPDRLAAFPRRESAY